MRKTIIFMLLMLSTVVAAHSQEAEKYITVKTGGSHSYTGLVLEETDTYYRIAIRGGSERVLYKEDIISVDEADGRGLDGAVAPKHPRFSVGIGMGMYDAYLGVSYRFPIKMLPGLYVMPGVYLSSYQFRTATIEIPLDLAFEFKLTDELSVMPYAGPCFSWYVPHWARFGFNGGLAFEFVPNIRVDIGLSSTAQNFIEYDMGEKHSVAAHDFYIGVSYMF